MTTGYLRPRLLARTDDVSSFVCRSTEQTAWLRRHARQSGSTGTTKTFIVTPVTRRETVVAYYAWCMAQLDVSSAPERLRAGAGRYPQPMALLARLGVHVEHERRGLGAALLADAVTRLLAIGDEIGCRGLLIHAETGEARDFYLHLVPDLLASPTDELHLVLLMKDARRTLLG